MNTDKTAPDTENYILEVHGLGQCFQGFQATEGVTFKVKKGEVFGIVGESGCGKTTTGRAIIRLYDATYGEVCYKGQRIVAGSKNHEGQIEKARKDSAFRQKQLREENRKQELKEEKIRIRDEIASIKDAIRQERADQKGHGDLVTGIQMIFQDPLSSLDPRMTIRDIIAEGLVIKGEKNQKVIDEKVGAVLEKVGLPAAYAARYPHEFSGGQRQRIGIARAVIMEPDVIIADEPVSALDVSVQAQVINLLEELRRENGITIIFIAHDLSVVKYFCDRIMVMYKGKVMEIADSDELFANPVHPYTRSLLSAIPEPDPEKEKNKVIIPYVHQTDEYGREIKSELREVLPGHIVRQDIPRQEQ